MMYNMGINSDSQNMTSDQSYSTTPSIYMPTTYSVNQPSSEVNQATPQVVQVTEVNNTETIKPIEVTVAPAQESPVYVVQENPTYAPQGIPMYAPQGNPMYAPQGDPMYAPQGPVVAVNNTDSDNSSSSEEGNNRIECPYCHNVIKPVNKMGSGMLWFLILSGIFTFIVGGFVIFIILFIIFQKNCYRRACPKCGNFLEAQNQNNGRTVLVPIFV